MNTYITGHHSYDLLNDAKKQYHHFPETMLVVCAVTLPNGHTVCGEYLCLDDEDFDVEQCEYEAYKDAIRKAHMLESYLLRQLLTMAEDPETMTKVRQLEAMEDKPRIVVPS